VGQGIPLQPAMHASEGMMQALNGTMPRPHSETVSRKQLTKMLAQVTHLDAGSGKSLNL